MTKHLTQSAVYALVASTVIVSLTFMAFFVAEPVISQGQTLSDEFRITQVITDETSFLVQPSNVSMAGSITGVTGGSATGTTQFSVISNNFDGYNVTIVFDDNLTESAMIGNVSLSDSIRNFGGDVAGEPAFQFTASTAAQFAYSVTSSTTGDTAQSFWESGGVCNAPAGTANGTCWKAPSTTAFTIVDRGSSAVTGATSTIYFRVIVPSGSVPAVTADTYTATATLSLLIN